MKKINSFEDFENTCIDFFETYDAETGYIRVTGLELRGRKAENANERLIAVFSSAELAEEAEEALETGHFVEVDLVEVEVVEMTHPSPTAGGDHRFVDAEIRLGEALYDVTLLITPNGVTTWGSVHHWAAENLHPLLEEDEGLEERICEAVSEKVRESV